MKTRRKTILTIVAGGVICIVLAGAGIAAWVLLSVFQSEPSDVTSASRQMEEARERFNGAAPLIQITSTRVHATGVNWSGELTHAISANAAPGALARLRVLTWRPAEGNLSRITIPWWLVRMKDDSLNLTEQMGGAQSRAMTLKVEDLERLGPALLIDHVEDDGARFLIWTE